MIAEPGRAACVSYHAEGIEYLSGQRGEISSKLSRRRRDVEVLGSVVKTKSLVRQEEEGFFLIAFAGKRDGTAERRSELILLELEWDILRQQSRFSISRRIAEKLPGTAVKLAGSRLSHNIDNAAHGPAEGRIVIVRLNLELLNIIDNWRHGEGASKRTLVVNTIQQEKIAAVSLTVYRRIGKSSDRIRPDPPATLGILGDVYRTHTGREIQNLSEIPSIEWQVIHLLPYDGNAQFRGRGFQAKSGSLHRNALRG